MEDNLKNALLNLGENALIGLFLALGDTQGMMGFNQLKREGRVNDAIIQMGISRAASNYRRSFKVSKS
jgi:hypothetical protein